MKKLLGLTAAIVMLLLPAIVHAQITSTSADQLVLMFQYSTTCGDKPVPLTYLYDKASMTMTPVKNNCMKSEMLPNFNNDRTLLVYTESDANNTYGDISVYNIASKTTTHLPLPDFANYATNDIAAYFDNNGKIIFDADGTLKKMDVDGTNITTIATPESPYFFAMFWMSPNREKIVILEDNQQGEDYHTSHYQRLVLMNADGTGRTVIGQEYLGDWNLLTWKEDSNSFFYYHHIFNVVGGEYQGQSAKYDLVNLYGGSANVTDLSNSYLGKEDGNVCFFTKSGNLLSLSAQELYNGQTGALIAHRPDVPTWTTAMFGSDSNGDIYFANFDGSNFRQFLESAQGPQGTPKISVSPMSVNCGSMKAGGASNPKTVTIRNTGNEDLIITSITISGTNQSEFIQTNNCSTVPAKGSCPITVTLAPVPPFGKKSATMSISSTDPKKPIINVKLLGQAPPPKITISPASVNFGSVAVGTISAPKIVTIKNTGTSDLTVNAITITGTNATDFSETNTCTTVAKGSSCAITIIMSPTSAGGETALMSISSNDPKKQVANVKLSGKGSGGSIPSAVNITGNWTGYHTQTGGTEQGPELMTFTQTGNSLSGTPNNGATQLTGTISGLNISISWTNSDGTTTLTGTVNANGTTMSGTYRDHQGSGTWRATKIS